MKSPTLAVQLGLAVRTKRKALELSQDAFADTIAMHRAYFSSIERGEKNVTLDTAARIAAGLGISLSELFREANI